MAKGILVSYAGYPFNLSSLFPDNGLASLAAVLRTEGHECEVLDFNTAELMARMVSGETQAELRSLLPALQGPPEPPVIARLLAASKKVEERGQATAEDIGRKLAARCRRERIDFVGFKLWSGDGFEGSVRMAEQIASSCPSVRLFAGGPAVHYSPRMAAAEAPVFHAVVDGDGEEAILELARYSEGKRELRGIPNLVSPSGERHERVPADLATLPMPTYAPDVYPSVASGEKLRLFCIDESRGCPMHCAFCVNCEIGGHAWRTRSAGRVVDEIQSLGREFGATAFRFTGNYSPPRLLKSVCDQILERELAVSFTLSLHLAGVDRDLLRKLKLAGCYGVFYGVESGSDMLLERAFNKRIRADRIRRLLKETLDEGLYTVGSFIFPAPFETEETEAETKELISEVFAGRERSGVIVNWPGLIPGTTWWRERDRYGFELRVSNDAFERIVLRHKIRPIVPPSLWKPPPYSLEGKDLSLVNQETARLQAWATDAGICVNLPDYDVLIGERLGYTPKEFKEEVRRHLFTADSEALQLTVVRTNNVLSTRHNPSDDVLPMNR